MCWTVLVHPGLNGDSRQDVASLLFSDQNYELSTGEKKDMLNILKKCKMAHIKCTKIIIIIIIILFLICICMPDMGVKYCIGIVISVFSKHLCYSYDFSWHGIVK